MREMNYFTNEERKFIIGLYAQNKHSCTTILRAFNREFSRNLNSNGILEAIRAFGFVERGKTLSMQIAMAERRLPEFKSKDYLRNLSRRVV